MNLDYRLFWLFAMLFIPFCSNRSNEMGSNEYVCASINSPELSKKVASLRRTLDSAIVKAEKKQEDSHVQSKKLHIISGLESIHNNNQPE